MDTTKWLRIMVKTNHMKWKNKIVHLHGPHQISNGHNSQNIKLPENNLFSF